MNLISMKLLLDWQQNDKPYGVEMALSQSNRCWLPWALALDQMGYGGAANTNGEANFFCLDPHQLVMPALEHRFWCVFKGVIWNVEFLVVSHSWDEGRGLQNIFTLGLAVSKASSSSV